MEAGAIGTDAEGSGGGILMSKRMIGTINHWSGKGYGWVTVPGQQDLYLHISQIEGRVTPVTGQAISFEVGSPKHGQRAEALKVKFLTDEVLNDKDGHTDDDASK
jgi:cold shock CspA family protein